LSSSPARSASPIRARLERYTPALSELSALSEFSLSKLCVLVALAFLLGGCAGGGGSGNAPAVANRPPPDWLSTGGKTPRYPRARYVTGFAMVELGPAHGGVDAAKQQAAASLSRNISVRIQASLRDVSESKDGADSYQIASIVNSTSDIQLTGLDYEVYPEASRSYALAYIDRGRAVAERRDQRERSLAQVRSCLASGARHEQAGREADAIDTYESCRKPIASALEHDSIARALGSTASSDNVAYAELVEANRVVDEKVRIILRSPASNLAEAIERLGIQLRRQNATGAGHLVVAPFTYGTTDLSSVFGRQASVELESVLARGGVGGAGSQGGDRVVRGVYLERDDEVRITATVRDTQSGRLVASAETTLPRRALPAGVSLKPANFESALRDQKVLAEGELVSGDLQVEVWTDRGRRGVVYAENDELTVHYRVNQPAWVRLVYVLQSGEQVPIAASWYVDASKVNQVITYPDSFEIVPPFGVEHIHATAFSSKPDPLVTEQRMISGESYEVVSNGLKQIVKTRGIKRKKREAMAESLVTVTTMPQ
jgi:hypothetical protein